MGEMVIFTIENGAGEIEIFQNNPEKSLQSAILLSLFGGNREDNGLDQKKTWWGNIDEQNPDAKMISQFQNIVFSLPLTSANRLRLQEAAESDLNWLIKNKIVKKLKVNIRIDSTRKVTLSIDSDLNIEDISVNI